MQKLPKMGQIPPFSAALEAMASSVIRQLVDAMTLCSQPAERPVRTSIDPAMAPEEAMQLLKDRWDWWCS